MRHIATVYALDGGAREIRCVDCGVIATPARGTPMVKLTRAARAHTRTRYLERLAAGWDGTGTHIDELDAMAALRTKSP